MIRALLSLLLTVNLLTCPLRCISCEPGETAGDEPVVVACSCCSHDCDVPVSNGPASNDPLDDRDDDCQCQDCICDGAVVEANVEVLETRSTACWVQRTSLVDPSTANSNEFLRQSQLLDVGKYLGGRDTRLAHQSWQI